MIAAIVKEARPKQWLKNVLVFAAPGAAGVLFQPRAFGLACLAFVAMCCAASGTYYWNDILDVDSDRQHPTKSKRPIAAGDIPLSAARIIGTGLMFAALGIMALTGEWKAVLSVALYIAFTLSYSAIWKHVAVIDLIVIAAGFVLRAAAGAYATDVQLGSWFLLVTAFGSLFIVTGKRFAESRQLGDEAKDLRSTLGEYSPEYLRFVLAVSCGAAIVSYCLWARDPNGTRSNADYGLSMYELSIVPMLAALLRYALVLDQGQGAAPEEVFASDRVLQVLGLIWVVVFGAAVYG